MTATTDHRPPATPTDLDPEALVEPVYRERARLVADLAARWPSVLVDPAPDLPQYAIVHVHGATGPMTWHVNRDHLDLMRHVRRVGPDHPMAQWDGSTTDEKYRRLRALRASQADAPHPVIGGRTAYLDGRGHLWITTADDSGRIRSLTPEYAPTRWDTTAGVEHATGTLTAVTGAQ